MPLELAVLLYLCLGLALALLRMEQGERPGDALFTGLFWPLEMARRWIDALILAFGETARGQGKQGVVPPVPDGRDASDPHFAGAGNIATVKAVIATREAPLSRKRGRAGREANRSWPAGAFLREGSPSAMNG